MLEMLCFSATPEQVVTTTQNAVKMQKNTRPKRVSKRNYPTKPFRVRLGTVCLKIPLLIHWLTSLNLAKLLFVYP